MTAVKILEVKSVRVRFIIIQFNIVQTTSLPLKKINNNRFKHSVSRFNRFIVDTIWVAICDIVSLITCDRAIVGL